LRCILIPIRFPDLAAGVPLMLVAMNKPLFAWESLEDSPSLSTIKAFLATIPDGQLLDGLRLARGRGRNDYPVHVLWGVVLLTVMLRHTGFEACLGELRRNEALRRLIGIESEKAVPSKWNVSRFLNTLGEEPHYTRVREIFATLIQRLGLVVEDLGKDTAGDATALHARRKRDAEQVKEEEKAGLPQPSGGKKEYLDDEGKVTKVFEWFGYKLHLIVDVKHEVAVAWEITTATAGDAPTLPKTLAQAQANLPENRIETLAFDKAADDHNTHKLLNKSGIKPLIEMRSLWKEEPLRMLPGHDGNSNIVYDEQGTIYCYDRTSDPIVRHRMAYNGYEEQRGTLKYRCPARHEGWTCPHDAVCNADKDYGRTLRVKCDIDLRRFPPIPRATMKFDRMYDGRTAVERVNGRLKIFWGADDGNISGASRVHAFVGVVMVVHAGFATLLAKAPRNGTLGTLHLGPIQKALAAAETAAKAGK
jgi:hypothetical protein